MYRFRELQCALKGDNHTSYLYILVHRHIIQASKKYTNEHINFRHNSQKVKIGQKRPRFCVFCAKNYTSSKKVHHRRLSFGDNLSFCFYTLYHIIILLHKQLFLAADGFTGKAIFEETFEQTIKDCTPKSVKEANLINLMCLAQSFVNFRNKWLLPRCHRYCHEWHILIPLLLNPPPPSPQLKYIPISCIGCFFTVAPEKTTK